jgi:[ribosomal protein S5]-alanine N-acetyltransferase
VSTPTRLETPRLTTRPFTIDDAEAAHGWFGDAEVMRFIWAGPDRSPDETRNRINRYLEHQSIHTFSRWIIVDRPAGIPIGDAGLMLFPGTGKIDLGYRFARPYWGAGLATEIASAWLRAAFVDFRLARVTAFADPHNAASLRVLDKVGFRRVGPDQVMGNPAITFALDAADFESRDQSRRAPG